MDGQVRELIDELKTLSEEELHKRLLASVVFPFAYISNYISDSIEDIAREFPQVIELCSSMGKKVKEKLFSSITDPELIKNESLRNEFFEYNNALLNFDMLIFMTGSEVLKAKSSKYIDKQLMGEKYEEFIKTVQENFFVDRELKLYALELAYRKSPEKVKKHLLENPKELSEIPIEVQRKILGDEQYIANSLDELNNPSLFKLSLKTDFNKTMEIVRNLGKDKTLYIDKYDTEILDILKENNYVFTPGDPMYQIRDALVLSFKNDPSATTFNLLKDGKGDFISYIASEEEIINVFLSRPDFVITKEIYRKSFSSKFNLLTDEVIKASFKNDPILTILVVDKAKELSLDTIDSKKIADFFIKNKDNLYINKSSESSFESNRKTFLKILESNPKIFEDIVSKDYDCALKLLSVLDVEKLSPNLRGVVINELKKHNWVPCFANDNPNMLKWLFLDSMRVDPIQTLDVMKDNFTIDKVREEYLKNKKELDEILVNVLTKGNGLGITSLLQFVNEDPSILIRALEKDFDGCKKTFNNYIRFALSQDKFYFLGYFDKKNSKEMANLLAEKEFYFDVSKGNGHLVYISSEFLMASLKNNFQKTLECMKDINLPSEVGFSKQQAMEIINIFRQHNSLDQAHIVLSRNSDLLAQVAKLDMGLFYSSIDKGDIKSIDEKSAKSILESIGIENIDFKKHPNMATLLGNYIFKNHNNFETRRMLAQHGFPFSMFEIKNDRDLRYFENNDEVVDLYNKIYFNSKKYKYDPKDEEKLLELLGSNFDCIEDELAKMYHQGLTRKDLNPRQMLLIALFVKKDHYNKGLENVNVNLFSYSNNRLTLGDYIPSDNSINLYNGQDKTIFHILETIIHETNHAKQNLDVRNCDVGSDDQIMVFAKDSIIDCFMRSVYKIDFYHNNYFKTAIEYDTEAKTQMEIAELLRIDIPLNLKGRGAGAILSNAIERNKYMLNGLRLHSETGTPEEDVLGELFDILLPEIISSGTFTPDDIRGMYPIIGYEYNLDANPVKKISNEELLEKYLHSKGTDKEIFLSIIKHHLDPTYFNDTEAFVSFINEYMEKNNVKDEDLIKSIGEEKIINCQTLATQKMIKQSRRQFNHYMDYARKILEQRKQHISTEEFFERMGR